MPSVVHYINHRDADGKICMNLAPSLVEASTAGSEAFNESSDDPKSFVAPDFFEFTKFAQLLIDAGTNRSVYSETACLSIIEQTTASGNNGHFRAWVRDKPQPDDLKALDAKAVVDKVRLSTHTICIHTHDIFCTHGPLYILVHTTHHTLRRC